MSDTPAPISATQADDIILELRTIRKLLEAQAEERKAAPPPPAPVPLGGSYVPPATSGGKFGDEPIPQPATIIANAGDVQIHFGKNQGKPLSSIGERSLSWYATEQPPRLDSSGKPYPPRPQEVILKNAARTLWHQLRGTLDTGRPTQQAPAQPATPPPAAAKPTAAPSSADDENVPF